MSRGHFKSLNTITYASKTPNAGRIEKTTAFPDQGTKFEDILFFKRHEAE